MSKHIGVAVDDALNYIDGRRKGKIKSLKTSLPKLNKALLDGIDWGRIVTIAGLSGAGKSTLVEQIKDDFFNLNKDQPFEVLSFEFEMLAQDQVARRLSSLTGDNIKDIYSALGNPVTDEKMDKYRELLEELKERPLFYVDESKSVGGIISYIWEFVQSRSLADNGKGLVVTIDHILLTQGKPSESEKAIIDALMKAMVSLKLELTRAKVPVIIILLGQLNREIESQDRVLKPSFHYPDKNDLFAASSTYYCSDYVIIIHKPSSIAGMKMNYGPAIGGWPKGLPLYNPRKEDQSMIYLHVIKERFGRKSILMMVDDLEHSKISEYEN